MPRRVIEIRFHGRGGQGAKIASRILGRSGFLCGLWAQDFALYGAERRGAPVVSFTRLSAEPIDRRGYIDFPELVVVMDASLLRDAPEQVFHGVGPATPVMINGAPPAGKLAGEQWPSANFVFVDLTGIARRAIGTPLVSAAAAAAAAKYIPAIGLEALEQAVRGELAEFGLPAELIEKNLVAARAAYGTTPAVDLAPAAPPITKPAPLENIPYPVSSRFAGPAIRRRGSAALRATGNWRTERPVIDLAKCKRCFLCYLYCPEAAMKLDADNFPHVDYEHCKGCLICHEECPTRAIARRVEDAALGEARSDDTGAENRAGGVAP